MKAKVSHSVLQDKESLTDWIEQHDRLTTEGELFAYQERNQQDWWLRNKQIRALFSKLEKEIKKPTNKPKPLLMRMVSWLRLAKDLSCDRATLKHPKRYYWVKERREELLNLIKNGPRSPSGLFEGVSPELTEAEQLKAKIVQLEIAERKLKESIQKLRMEVGRIFEQHLNDQERILELESQIKRSGDIKR